MRNNELMKYAGMATMIIATLGVAIFLGLQVDKVLHFTFPIGTILFPIMALISIFYKVYKDSSSKK